MNRCRLIYKSEAIAEIPSNEMIRDIAEKASVHNAGEGITGLLVLSGNRFLQVLEGPYGPVNALFGRIVRDTRHGKVELITFEALETNYFNDWHMRLVDLYDLPGPERGILTRKYAHKGGEILIPEHLHEVYGLLLDARDICRDLA
jgi:hypothetical protein